MKTVQQRRNYLLARLEFHITNKLSNIQQQNFSVACEDRTKERRIKTRLKNLDK